MIINKTDMTFYIGLSDNVDLASYEPLDNLLKLLKQNQYAGLLTFICDETTNTLISRCFETFGKEKLQFYTYEEYKRMEKTFPNLVILPPNGPCPFLELDEEKNYRALDKNLSPIEDATPASVWSMMDSIANYSAPIQTLLNKMGKKIKVKLGLSKIKKAKFGGDNIEEVVIKEIENSQKLINTTVSNNTSLLDHALLHDYLFPLSNSASNTTITEDMASTLEEVKLTPSREFMAPALFKLPSDIQTTILMSLCNGAIRGLIKTTLGYSNYSDKDIKLVIKIIFAAYGIYNGQMGYLLPVGLKIASYWDPEFKKVKEDIVTSLLLWYPDMLTPLIKILASQVAQKSVAAAEHSLVSLVGYTAKKLYTLFGNNTNNTSPTLTSPNEQITSAQQVTAEHEITLVQQVTSESQFTLSQPITAVQQLTLAQPISSNQLDNPTSDLGLVI